MTETYAVRFEITPATLTEATRLLQATFLSRFRLLMAVFVVVGGVIALSGDPSLGVTIAGFAVLMLATTWMQFLDRWLFKTRARGFVGGIAEYVVDDVGAHYKNPLSSGTIPWSSLTKVMSNEKMIVFARDRVAVAYFPTTAFASAAERDAFLTFARAHVPTSAPKPTGT